jgi:hypothetical protein
MVCFVNVGSVDRILYAIFNGMNESMNGKTAPSGFLHKQLDVTRGTAHLQTRGKRARV